MNPKNIVKDAVAILRLLIIGSSPCLFYNFGKLLCSSRSLCIFHDCSCLQICKWAIFFRSDLSGKI